MTARATWCRPYASVLLLARSLSKASCLTGGRRGRRSAALATNAARSSAPPPIVAWRRRRLCSEPRRCRNCPGSQAAVGWLAARSSIIRRHAQLVDNPLDPSAAPAPAALAPRLLASRLSRRSRRHFRTTSSQLRPSSPCDDNSKSEKRRRQPTRLRIRLSATGRRLQQAPRRSAG